MINSFGIELLHRAGQPGDNLLLSPYSIQAGLASAYAGAEGRTREEMAEALDYPEDETELHAAWAGLRHLLQQNEHDPASHRDHLVELTLANRLFGQSGHAFRDSFQELLKTNYGAPLERLDFAQDPGACTRHINEWVSTQTHQRIRNLISPSAFNHLIRLVLVNSIYFKAPWFDPFESWTVTPQPFHVSPAKSVPLPTMTQSRHWRYAQGDGFTALELPFRDRNFRLLIFLPDQRDGLADLAGEFSPEVLTDRLAWEERYVTLFLPKFRLEPPLLALGAALRSLGLNSAFDVPRGSANFERMAPRRPDDYLFISEVFHQAFLELDENGVEAAAADAIQLLSFGGRPPAAHIQMRVDHPFIVAVLHCQTGTCLFLGRVIDPSRSDEFKTL